jgi:four helix bundle protein
MAVDGLRLVQGGARGYGDLVDQFRRAVTSVALNVAEGLSRRGVEERQYFRVARGSALEASTALALLVAIGAAEGRGRAVEHRLDQFGVLWSLAKLSR